MNTRLVWNFEIRKQNLLNFEDLNGCPDELHWEARYFWPGDAIIPLNGLDSRFFQFSNYKAKHRQDFYFLLADLKLNIKQRRTQLFYKPLLQERDLLQGYGKKINLEDYPSDLVLPGCNLRSAELLEKIARNSHKVEVSKEALIYKFATEAGIKLELARLEIKEKVYFSLCVEGRSEALVSTVARHILSEEKSCDYVSFLKQVLKSC